MSKGAMPVDFSTTYTGKFKASLGDVAIKDLNKKSGKEFAAMINFSIDNLLKSGRVIYGDPISERSNVIAEKLLEGVDIAEHSIRVYTLKSNDVNAYSTHQGIVLLTTGLVARMQNESELAFVLSHEIAHVLSRHSVKSFSYNKEVFKKDVSKKGSSIDESVLKSTKHSRENEFEADTKGLELYANAGYDPALISGAFQRLLYAYLPVKQVPLDTTRYEGGLYQIKTSAKEYEIIELDIEEDVDDTESSHPNIYKRKENIKTRINNDVESTGLAPNTAFIKLRSQAYRECIYQYIIEARYIDALVLLDAIDEEIDIDKNTVSRFRAMCFFGIQKFAKNGQKSAFVRGGKLQGPQGAYHYLFRRLNVREIQTIAFRQLALVWSVNQDDLVIDRLLHEGAEILAESVDVNSFNYDVEDGKTMEKKCHTCEFALVDIENSDKLKLVLAKKDQKEINSVEVVTKQKKVVMFSPRYIAMDMRKTIDERFLETQKQKEYIEARILQYAEKLDLEIEILDYWQGAEMDTEEFNRYSLMMDWLRERANYSEESFKGLMYEDINGLSKMYKTDAIAFSSYWNLLERKKFKPVGLLTLAFPYTFPLYLYWQLTPHHYTGYSYAMLDSETGRVLYVDSKEFDMKYNKKVINAHLYNSLNQVAR